MSSSDSFYSPASDLSKVDSICLGSGRFLRSVLVPALNEANLNTAIFQTRGSSFLKHCIQRYEKSSLHATEEKFLSYELDTVQYDSVVKTEVVQCTAAGTLGTDAGKESLMSLLEKMEW